MYLDERDNRTRKIAGEPEYVEITISKNFHYLCKRYPYHWIYINATAWRYTPNVPSGFFYEIAKK